MALHSLITTQFPRDYLGLVGFGELARELKARSSPRFVDYTYGTNMQHACSCPPHAGRQSGTKQIIMITTVSHRPRNARRGTVLQLSARTGDHPGHLNEVVRATRDGIRINTFMLDATISAQFRGEDDAAEPRSGLLHHAGDSRGLRSGGFPGAKALPPRQPERFHSCIQASTRGSDPVHVIVVGCGRVAVSWPDGCSTPGIPWP